MINCYIDKILKDCKITDFLEKRGIIPVKKSGDKFVYHCPVHSGDNDPSFIVYPVGTKGRDYQTYYCFGCHSGINIINLKSDLDKSPTIVSIKSFLKEVDIDSTNVTDSIIKDIQNGKVVLDEGKHVDELLLMLSITVKRHLDVYQDEEEWGFVETFFEKVDSLARARDISMLEKVADMLPRGLDKRVVKFKERQEDKELSAVTWKI